MNDDVDSCLPDKWVAVSKLNKLLRLLFYTLCLCVCTKKINECSITYVQKTTASYFQKEECKKPTLGKYSNNRKHVELQLTLQCSGNM